MEQGQTVSAADGDAQKYMYCKKDTIEQNEQEMDDAFVEKRVYTTKVANLMSRS